jgi:hypothetical protein
LFNELASLVDGNVATGDLMETTADDNDNGPADIRDIGNDVPLDSQYDLGDLDDDIEEEEHEAVVVAPSSTTPLPSKRKRGSAISPDMFLSELRTLSSEMADSMRAPIPPITFTRQAPPPSFHMQAIELVQKEEGLEANKIFEAIEFLGHPTNSETYVALSEVLRPTWLRMKLGWQA